MNRFFARRGRGLRRSVACATAVVAVSAISATAANAAPSPSVAVPHVRVSTLGPTAASKIVRVALELNYRNADELEAFIRASSDPSSPQFGHFLTPAQFDAAFGPTAADRARVVSTLAVAGFTIGASPTRSLVVASAPAAVVERFFGTKLATVQQAGVRGLRYLNVAPATVPASLRDVTYGVSGLNDLVVAKTLNVRSATHSLVALGPPLQGPDTGLSPYAFASAYHLPVQYANPAGGTYDGLGHGAAIAIDSDMLDTDVSGFLSYFGIARTGPPLARELVDGGPSPLINGDGDETNLDVQTIEGVAPGSAVTLYLMPDLSTAHIVDTYAQIVADNKVDVVNSSFGGCELADNLGQLADHIAQQGAAEGITFAASSGDAGAVQCIGYTDNFLGVSAPASAPHFTAVGGTSLIVNSGATYRLEYAWTGSGGGPSVLFATPSYQKGIKGLIGSTRNVPDVAFDANPGTGAAFYYNGIFQGPIGGTSLASPLFSAYVTELNEVHKKRSGAIDTALYSKFKATGYGTAFHDITIGNNELYGSYYGGYFAGPGYDDVTGIGSLIGMPYAK